MTLTPAYGRNYQSKEQVLQAWNEGKDFIVADPFHGGKYINKADAEHYAKGEIITIRYSNNTKCVVLTIAKAN